MPPPPRVPVIMLLLAALTGAPTPPVSNRLNDNLPRPPAEWCPPEREPARFERRRADWRCGPVVYQAVVDRFAPSARLDAKREHYPPPAKLMEWHEVPCRGERLPEHRVLEGEVQFWGGDLESLRARLDYLQELGVGLLYLNPVFKAFTNHKYDAVDYRTVDPQYGTNEELAALAEDLHGRGMRLMLDGVFNHVGRRFPLFQKALADPAAPERAYFRFEESPREGYLGWRNVPNLPELNLDHPDVASLVYGAPDSIVRHYIREAGIDGWRLDVAPDLGFEHLGRLTAAAHEEKPGSCVIGECWNYPKEWLRVLDGILNMHPRAMIIQMLQGKLPGGHFGRLFERMAGDCTTESLLRSHLVLDNHDLPRLAHVLPAREDRRLATFLQFTLPGSPVLYYGTELGMDGGDDPGCRAPMRWDLLSEDNETLAWYRRLLELRCRCDALRVGDYIPIDTRELFAFMRLTDRALEGCLVVLNPTNKPVEELVQVRDSRMVDDSPFICELSGEEIHVFAGLVEARLPPKSFRIFRTTDRGYGPGYSAFKRIP